MSKRKCIRCGLDPAEGFASVWTAKTGEQWYCHGDDDESPTCYERAQVLHLLEDRALRDMGLDPADLGRNQ